MLEHAAILLDQRRFGQWHWLTLQAAPLAAARPGQFGALRCAPADSYDPLLRQPLFIAATDPHVGTFNLLVETAASMSTFLTSQPAGAALNMLGPLGQGWQIASDVRALALVGTLSFASALFGLAHYATTRGLAVSMLLGSSNEDEAPPPFLLSEAVEYNVAHASDPVAAALDLLDEETLRWADLLAIALPLDTLSAVAERVRRVRLQWRRGFAQVALLPFLACCVGVCGVCMVDLHHAKRLACIDGPIFDLRDLVG